MRPKGIVGLAVVVLLFIGIAYLLSDKFIERGIEKGGEAVVGAKVEVDNLDFRPVDLFVSLRRMQVTNPNDTWKNLFETRRLAFDMATEPLLSRKKIIINEVSIADVRIGTKRETDGKLPEKKKDSKAGWVDKAAESLKRQVASAPILSLGILNKKINVDNILQSVDLKSVDRIEDFKQDIKQTQEEWEKEISEFDPKNDLAKVESQVNELKTQEIKGATDLISAAEKTKRVYDTANELKKSIEQKKSQAIEDFKRMKTTFASVDNWIADDFNSLKSRANLGDFTPQNIGVMLFGKKIVQSILDLLPFIETARKYMPVAQQVMKSGKVERPPRLQGQDVIFPLRVPQPDFLIEHIFISGATNQEDTSKVLHLSGQVNGITSHPRVYGKPLTFQLKAQFLRSNAYQITGEFDHTGDIPSERFEVRASGVRLGQVELPARPYLPSKIHAGKADVITDFRLKGKELGFKLALNARPVDFSFADSLKRDDVISRVTTGVFDSIDLLQLSASISGPVDDLKLKINSNIDNILADRIKAVIGESAKAARAEIQKRLTAIVAPKKQEVETLIGNFQNEVLGEINKIENGIDSKLTFLDEKKQELQKKLTEEKAKDVTKKLKDIFKN
ncbi:TIGR03545 family protein [candidate division KSB1 bacterium]|nr:TIGR03545 family protein [candidate division KSB1 bacterium]NIR69752.1 TIGR03545 family protein [candidate division KSB1 bacterium]NIS25781.1 TIGR03545 family protein [candidate division KSB1 bacterium]NIT72655.1 TIGR03545 family protein [candidate division KSB1 bacterium]NIU26470.1 TIGR03545 family protein [candidate division KSB1 bacterium]